MSGTMWRVSDSPVTCYVRVACAVPGLDSILLLYILPQISGGKPMNFIGMLEARVLKEII
jgi:hypothetical protein